MSSRRIESFVVRIVVREDELTSGDDWCGRIQHIATGEEYQFNQLQDLLLFMSTHFQEPSNATRTATLQNGFFRLE